VARGELVKGYQVAKDRYVPVTEEELWALADAASTVMDIT
jgi:non-homologous end joining protein Ku